MSDDKESQYLYELYKPKYWTRFHKKDKGFQEQNWENEPEAWFPEFRD